MLYVLWNNGYYQAGMGYWLKSFNKKPYPVPGVHFTIPEINNRGFPPSLVAPRLCQTRD